ncbi:hypothetical protein ASD24_06605 [Paenibacillus sp. Root52]|uniref:hypothetical protein n=1 Tax=Paenibacillus sp. Root52 TaxID=1736552 RepID=UPI0006F876A7|nr:hypothetical protein [Paenibacillus sp. Root52]KQY87519.1 hypothetical protein ASD24_06605 [Paenibacillus sp. Root52]
MCKHWIVVGWIILLFSNVGLGNAEASVASESRLDQQTRDAIAEKYGLEPTEDATSRPNLLSGDWGASFDPSTTRYEIIISMILWVRHPIIIIVSSWCNWSPGGAG